MAISTEKSKLMVTGKNISIQIVVRLEGKHLDQEK